MVPDLRPDALGDHIDRLYRAAWAMCGSREDAEDLVQETYAKVLAKPRWLEQDDELGYLLRTLRNVFISSLRTKDRRPQTIGMEAEEEARIPSSAPSTADVVSSREVFTAISALPEDFRDVVVAVDVVGLSYAEAADALKIKQGTVMSRLSRGRGKLAERLEA
ncbi:MAG: RNA polymerase sigma factor [Solirubrobacteraceae bacterium]|nr:RNA polymerase sigma factor [Solirubrobacteraceae bacterium]